jgi:large subunit ribosomal protein L49
VSTRSTGILVRFQPPAEGESPPPVLPPDEPLPFRVHRSRNGNLPVYSDFRIGGSKVVTILRKYQGDVDALSTAVSRLCESDVYKFHGRIEVKGKHGRTLRNWLANDLGF